MQKQWTSSIITTNNFINLSALDTADKRTLVAVANTYIENYELDAITVKVQGNATAETTDIQYNLDYEKVTK